MVFDPAKCYQKKTLTNKEAEGRGLERLAIDILSPNATKTQRFFLGFSSTPLVSRVPLSIEEISTILSKKGVLSFSDNPLEEAKMLVEKGYQVISSEIDMIVKRSLNFGKVETEDGSMYVGVYNQTQKIGYGLELVGEKNQQEQQRETTQLHG